MAKLSLRDPARAAHLVQHRIPTHRTEEELAARRAERAARAADRAERHEAFVRRDVRAVSQHSEKCLRRSDKCDVAGGESLRPIGAVSKCNTNTSGMLRDDVRAEGLEAYCVNSVNPVTPNPHSIVNGTIGAREVSRPTLTRPPSHSAPYGGLRSVHAPPPPPPPGTLLPRRACVRCTYDFHPKSLPSRPWGYSYCGSCHRDLNFKYCRALRARKVKLRRAYLIERGDLAPDACG